MTTQVFAIISDDDDFEIEEVTEHTTTAVGLEEDSYQDTEDDAAQRSKPKIKWRNSSFMPVVHDYNDRNSEIHIAA